MPDWTYDIPNEENYMKALLLVLKQKGLVDISELLKKSRCKIHHAGQFSRRRWNAVHTNVHFYIPINEYEGVINYMTDEKRNNIMNICDQIMPKEAGLDVTSIDFSPALNDIPEGKTLMDSLEETTDGLSSELMSYILPIDVKEKARDMSEVYLYLYCVENALRLFIEKVGIMNYGDVYLKELGLNKEMERKIKNRKKSQEKKKWLSVRGNSDIFYLDIDDLGNLIRKNWNIFNPYFESQEWIVTNIGEINDCRNPIAHHSYIGQVERDVIRINFTKILKQISTVIEPTEN